MSEQVLPPASWDCNYRTGLPLSGSCETPSSIGAATPADVAAAQSASAADATAKVAAHNASTSAHDPTAGLSKTAFEQLADVTLWQHFDPAVGSTHVCVPLGVENLHAEYAIRTDTAGLRNLATVAVVRPFIFTAYNGTGVSISGTWTETTADAKYRAGKAYFTTANTAYIDFAFTGSSVGVWFHTTTNAGWVLVAIDGDYTAATHLPAVTADLCSETPDVSHPFLPGDVGKRYMKQLYTSPCDRWELIADGLSEGAHTVRLRAAAVTSSTYRPYVSGFGHCTRSTAFSASGAVPAAVVKVCAGVAIGATQFGISETLPVIYNTLKGDFLGGAHGSEAMTSYKVWLKDGTLYHDSAGALPTANSKTYSQNVTVRRTSTINHSATDLATRTIVLDFCGAIKGSLLVRDKWEWLVGADGSFITRHYPLMIPAGYVNAGLVAACAFDRATWGTRIGQQFASDGTSWYSGGSKGRQYSVGGYAFFGELIPAKACQSFLHDRALSSGPKLYFCNRGLDQRDYVYTGRVDESASMIGVGVEPST